MIFNSLQRASISGDVNTASINTADSVFVINIGYDRNKKPYSKVKIKNKFGLGDVQLTQTLHQSTLGGRIIDIVV